MEDTHITVVNVNSGYQRLVDNISALWKQAKENAVAAVNTELQAELDKLLESSGPEYGMETEGQIKFCI